MTFMIFPYTQGSAGAKAIAEELGGKRILRQNSTYTPKDSDVIINWGASDCPFPQALNYGTKDVTNKIKFFERLKGKDLTPRFTTSRAAAEFMKFPVFCRTTVEGKDGEGIVVAENINELVDAKLYVEGVNKKKEFRVHMGRWPDGSIRIIGVQQKFVPNTAALENSNVWAGEGTNFVWTVNGNDVALPSSAKNVAEKAFAEFPELAFGAFDIVYEELGLGSARAYVLEMNSAPTITPKTAEIYGAFFRLFEKPEVVPVVTVQPAWQADNVPFTPAAPTVVEDPHGVKSIISVKGSSDQIAKVKAFLAEFAPSLSVW